MGAARTHRGRLRAPRRVLAVVAVLAIAGAALALRLEPSAATTRWSARARRVQGDRALPRALRRRRGHRARTRPLTNIVLTANLDRLIGLEGCLAGNTPTGATPPGGTRSPCGRLTRPSPCRWSTARGPSVAAASA